MKQPIKVIIAEDHKIYRKAIVEHLKCYDIEAIAECSNGKELLAELKTRKADVVLLDLEMPELDGNATMDLILRDYPEARIIIVTAFGDFYLQEDYLLRGAKGYLTKDEIVEGRLAAGIKRVYEGGFIRSRMVEPRPEKITSRQIEIINLEAREVPKKEIAKRLNLTRDAVYKQEKAIKGKLGIKKGSLRKAILTLGLHYLGNRLK